jgi:hypothetical protein
MLQRRLDGVGEIEMEEEEEEPWPNPNLPYNLGLEIKDWIE